MIFMNSHVYESGWKLVTYFSISTRRLLLVCKMLYIKEKGSSSVDILSEYNIHDNIINMILHYYFRLRVGRDLLGEWPHVGLNCLVVLVG